MARVVKLEVLAAAITASITFATAALALAIPSYACAEGPCPGPQTPVPKSTTSSAATVVNMRRDRFLANLLSTKVYGARAGISAQSDRKLVEIGLQLCDTIAGRGDDVAQLVANEMLKQGAVTMQYDADVFVATATTAFCNY